MTKTGSTLYLLVVSAAIFVCCMSILTSTIRLGFGMARDDQLPFSRDDGEGQPAAPHAGRGVHHRRALAAIPFIQFVGCRGHRRRRDRVDLPQLPAREPRRDAGADAWMAEDEGAVHARRRGARSSTSSRSSGALAMLVNFLTPFVGERSLGSERVGSELPADLLQPETGADRLLRRGRSAARLQDRRSEQDPGHLDWCSRVVFIPGVIYYFAVQRKKPWEPAVHPRGRGPGRDRAGGVRPSDTGYPGGGRFAAAPGTGTGGSLPHEDRDDTRRRCVHPGARRQGLGLARSASRPDRVLRLAGVALRTARCEPPESTSPAAPNARTGSRSRRAPGSRSTTTSAG